LVAKGGGKRTYVRDGNGRFASTPGGAAKKAAKSTSGRKGTLGARTGLKGSKAKLKAKDKADQTLQNTLSTRAQKGAVKRGSRKLAAAKVAAQTRIGGGRKGVIGKSRGLKPGVLAARREVKPAAPANLATRKASKGPKTKLPRTATPAGAIRRSDLAKVKADARKGIGTPMSRAGQRAIARSAREAPLQRKQAIAAAKRKGRTGFGKGPKMNTGAIGNRDFNWNRNEQPATAQERLAMWRRSERRMIRNTPSDAGKRGYYGALRASRRAAELVDMGNRRGNLPTTRKMAEEPRQRRSDRISRNETQGRLTSSEASRRLLPQIQKVRDAGQKRIAEGKKPTAAQKEKERKLVGEYNKAVRKLQVAEAAKSYMQNPYGFKAQRMSGAVKPAKLTRTKGSKVSLPRTPGTVAKPKGLKPGIKMSKGKARAGQAERAIARALKNQLNSEDPRNKNPNARIYSERGNRPGKKQMRSMLRADSALDFYRDPAKALRTSGINRTKPGYRVPRELSLNFDVWPKRRRKRQP
jgi:hypothetical protein